MGYNRLMRSNYDRPAVLWPTVREELVVFKGLMIYLHADWTRPWNSYVTSSDASLSGFGIVSSVWKAEDVAEVGRCQERSRFKKLGSHSARDSALTHAGFVRDEVTDQWKAGVLDADEFLELSGWGLNQTFKEVPGHLLHKDNWTPRLWGKWKYHANILELEARALVKSLRRIANSIFGQDIRQICLTDNMSVCLAFDRSRAKNFALLSQIRIFGAYCLARNIACTIRWIPSELNSADEPSRLDDEEPSKTLTHVVPVFKGTEKRERVETSPDKIKVRSPQVKGAGQAQGEPRVDRPKTSAEEGEADRETEDPSPSRKVFIGGRVDRGATKDSEEESKEPFRLNQFNQERWEEEAEAGPPSQVKLPRQEGAEPHHGAWNRDDLFGGAGHWPSSECPVSERAEGLHGFSSSPWHPDQSVQCHGVGWAPCRLPEPDVLGWPPELQGGSSPGVFYASPPGVWEEWRHETAEDLESYQGVQEIDTWQKQRGFPTRHLGCLCCRDEEAWQVENEHIPYAIPIKLCEALGAPSGSSVLPGTAGCIHQSCLEPFTFPGGASGEKQDRRVRHFNSSRQPLPDWMDRELPGVPEMCSSRKPSMEYQRTFKLVSRMLGIEATPYQTNSGPSIDRARNYRSQLEVQKRGQWRAQKSVMRYEKSARLALSWEKVPQLVKDYALSCEENLGEFLLGRKEVPKFAGNSK